MQDIMKNRPMTMGELFSMGWDVYTKNIKKIFVAMLMFFLPVSLLDGYFQMLLNFMAALVVSRGYPTGYDALASYLGMVTMPTVVLSLLSTVLLTFGQAVVYFMIYGFIYEKPLSIREASRLVWPRLLPLMGGQILAGVVIVIATCLLIIPGIYASTIWRFFFMFMLFRGEGITESFSSSTRLVRGNWWFTFGLSLIIVITSEGIMKILGFILDTNLMVPAIIHAFIGYCVAVAFFGVDIVYFLHREALVDERAKVKR